MKKLLKQLPAVILVGILVTLILPVSAYAQGPGGKVVAGGNVTLEDGESIDGDLVVFGGSVMMEDGSSVEGDVAVFGGSFKMEEGSEVEGEIAIAGGSIDIGGDVEENLGVAGGNVVIRDTAYIGGNVEGIGSNVEIEEGATIEGKVREGAEWDFGGDFPNIRPQIVPRPFPVFVDSAYSHGYDVMGNFLTAVVFAVVLSLIGLLIVLLLPRHVETTASAATSYMGMSFGVGLLTWIVGSLVGALLLLACGLGLLVFAALAIASLFGWIVMGYIVGLRLLEMVRRGEGQPVLAVVVGTSVITLLAKIPYGVDICCIIGLIGFLFTVVIGSIGLGATVLTRFGSRPYTRSYTRMYAPPAPPAPPTPPAPSTGEVAPDRFVEAPPAPKPEEEPPTEPELKPEDEGKDKDSA